MHSHNQNLVKAVPIFLLGYFFLAAMGACNKLVSPQTSTFTILFFQNAICLILTLPQVVKNGWAGLRTERIWMHLVRDLCGISSFFFLFWGLKTIPLVDGLLLLNTSPLWLPLIALIWLRVRMKSYVWWSMIVGFVGIVLILEPGSETLQVGALLALAAGLLAGITFLTVAKLTSTEPVYRILFYYFLLGTLISAPLGLAIPSRHDFLFLIGVGGFCFLAQALLSYSFKHGKASILAPFSYSVVIFSGLFDWLLWDHIPNLLTLLGVILVVIGAILSIYFEKKYQKKLTELNQK